MLPIPHTGKIAIVAQSGDTMRHRWLPAEAVHAADDRFMAALDWAAARNSAGENIFYSTGGFEGELTPFKGRTSANVVSQRSLWLDLDCAKHGIDAGTTGFDAVFEWVQENPNLLVPSMVVNSGGGLHLYWISPDELPLDRWHAAADRLRNGAKEVFFSAVDVQCTIDRARILRVPGFDNYKYDPPAPVETMWPFGEHEQPLYSIDELEAMVACWPRTAAALAAPSVLNLSILAGLPSPTQVPGSAFADADKSDPASWNRMSLAATTGEGCKVLQQAMADNSSVDYNTWCGLLTVIACTDNAEAGIHAISADHPDWGDTQNVDTAMAKAQSFGGPRRCASFAAENAACGECKLRGTITSPVEVGRKHVRIERQEAPVTYVPEDFVPEELLEGEEPAPARVPAAHTAAPFTLPPAPAGYRYSISAGKYGVWRDDLDGDYLKLFDCPVWVDSFYVDNGAAEGVLGFLLPDGHVGHLKFSGAAVTDAARSVVRGELANMGVHMEAPPPAGTKQHAEAVALFITQLTSAIGRERVAHVDHFGPASQTDRTRFDLGGVRYHANGATSRVKIKDENLEGAVPDTLPDDADRVVREWNAHLATLHDVTATGPHGPARALDRMITCLGFAAVLPTFLEAPAQHGGIISLTSPKGGSGKTSMATTALSIYAKDCSKLTVTDGTRLGALKRATAACAIPVLLDDFTQNTKREDMPEALSNMLLASTAGGGRARASNDAPAFSTTWRWVTTNKDVAGLVASLPGDNSGPLRRLFDIRVPMREGVTAEQRDRFKAFSNWTSRNGGVVGHIWVRHVVTNQDQLAVRYAHWRKVMTDQCPALANSQHEFIHSMATCAMVAAEAAGKLGLHPYRILDVQNTLVDYIEQSTAHFRDHTADDVSPISTLLRSHLDSTCIKNKNGVSNFGHDQIPRTLLDIRRYPDSGEVAISAKLVSRSPAADRIRAEMVSLGAEQRLVDLGEGTHAAARPTFCWIFKLPTTVSTPTTAQP